MVGVEESGFLGHFVVDAKVLEKDECSPLMWKNSQVFAVTVVPRHSQVSEALSEVKAMYSMVAVVLKTVASLPVVWAGVELVEPKVVDVGLDFALGTKNSWDADHALEGTEPMMAGNEPGQALEPMDSNWLGVVLEVVLGLFVSRVAELGLESVMESMH